MDKNYFRDTEVGEVDVDISNLVTNKTPLKDNYEVMAKGKKTKDTKIYMTITC